MVISDLPTELRTVIFEYLDFNTIKSVISVSKKWRHEGLQFLTSGVLTIKPEHWKEQIKSEVIKCVGKLRFRGFHNSSKMKDVLEILMHEVNWKYQSLDFNGQKEVNIRKATNEMLTLIGLPSKN